MIDLLVEDHQNMSTEEIHEMLEIAQKSAQKLTKRFLQYAQLDLTTSDPRTIKLINPNLPKFQLTL